MPPKKTRSGTVKADAENSVKPKRQGHKPAKPFEKGNPYAFPKGVSGNPGGRPKLLSHAYRDWLSLTNKKAGLTNAQLVAQQQGFRAIVGADTMAAKEIRQATEGDKIDLSHLSDEGLDRLIAQLERLAAAGAPGKTNTDRTPQRPDGKHS